ncbi:LysR family transcriptional regulator [Acerihabitans arboris]|uniref:LysR family transcriptional regulator n=1 Tax=Acerihabitans arboris TaxID=2691583 RepID=A0A845SNS1_9GAMM|nr:LysR family transcriptional regulator [Acerihabitans arboris]NDL64574.1 LysR family transcriptional regulator [Acerihabitans arboris]
MDRLAAMETFVYVLETGSFSAAARRLNIGQPAVSKTIAQLEERFGVRLLLRSTRGLTPTEAGEEYYQSAKRAIDDINQAEAAVRGAGHGLTGRLRICAPVTFARMHILPHLGPFLSRHPELNVDVVLDDRHIDLIAEGIDVGLRLGALSDSSLIARKLGAAPLQIVGTPAYFARRGEPKNPEDLLSHQAVVYTQSRGGGARWIFTRGEEICTINALGRIRVSAAEGMRTLVRSGLGLAMASQWMFAPEQASGEVVTVLNDWHLPMMDLWAVFPTGRMASAKARAFVDYLAGVMETAPDTDLNATYSQQE